MARRASMFSTDPAERELAARQARAAARKRTLDCQFDVSSQGSRGHYYIQAEVMRRKPSTDPLPGDPATHTIKCGEPITKWCHLLHGSAHGAKGERAALAEARKRAERWLKSGKKTCPKPLDVTWGPGASRVETVTKKTNRAFHGRRR